MHRIHQDKFYYSMELATLLSIALVCINQHIAYAAVGYYVIINVSSSHMRSRTRTLTGSPTLTLLHLTC